MAKKLEQKAKTDSNGQNRVQGFVFGINLEGSRDVVMDGIKAFTQAMAKTGATLAPPATRPTLIQGGKQTSATAVADVEEPDTAEEVGQGEEGIEEETAQEESISGNGSGQKRSYNFKSPDFLNDLDFSTPSKSLEDFMAEKGNPTEMLDRYLVTIVWFKDYMKIEEVTVHHIYTAFDHVGWKSQIPVKPSKPLSDLKSKRHVLTREPGAEGYKLNFKGIQYVEKMGATK